jgi:hypothetical protein
MERQPARASHQRAENEERTTEDVRTYWKSPRERKRRDPLQGGAEQVIQDEDPRHRHTQQWM